MTETNFEQELNIYDILVTFDRFIFVRSIDCNDEHSENIYSIFSTFCRFFGKVTDSYKVQPLNIPFILVTFVRLELERSIDCNDERSENV